MALPSDDDTGLFDGSVRTDDRAKSYTEPAFAFLNRTARVEFALVRDLLESWYSRYPTPENLDLRSRFRSTIDAQHESAFFELFLHEMLLRLGCVVEVHPNVGAGTSRHPDFLVETATDRFYLEAVVASEESDREKAERKRENEVYDALDRLDAPNFFIGMNLKGAPRTPPPARKIRDGLKNWLDALDPDEISSLTVDGWHGLPTWDFQHDGWNIEFYPIPKSPEARGKAGVRPLGIRSYGMTAAKAAAATRTALDSKAGRYGHLGLPYVIAVNVLPRGADQSEVMEALFGDERMIVEVGEHGPAGTRMDRAGNGAWISQGGPRSQRVSGALICSGVQPWTIARSDVRLYHHPWAIHQYNSVLTRLPQAVPRNQKMSWEDGETVAAILELPENWPFEQVP